MPRLKAKQKQIKAFNKALSRAKQKGTVLSVLDGINELIDYERMTHKTYAKAGTKEYNANKAASLRSEIEKMEKGKI